MKKNDLVETGLQALFQDPDPVFLSHLEADLLARGRIQPEANKVRWTTALTKLFTHRAFSLALAVVLVMAIAVFTLGPSQVLAQIRQVLGYLPGVGFVNSEVDQVWVLSEPVVDVQNGVTMTVENIIGLKDKTLVTLSFAGIAPDEIQQWVLNYSIGITDRSPLKTLQTNWHWNWEKGLFLAEAELEPLPSGTRELQIFWSANFVPTWQTYSAIGTLSLPLKEAALSEALQAPLVYNPIGVQDSHHDITLRVLDVSQSTERIALNLEIQWPDDRTRLPLIGPFILEDNFGQDYASTDSNNMYSFKIDENDGQDQDEKSSRHHTYQQTLAFSPGGLEAGGFTLQVENLNYRVETYKDAFEIDLGENPQVGDEIPVEIKTILLDGIPVQIERARIVEVYDSTGETNEKVIALEFDIAPLAPLENRRIISIDFYPSVFFREDLFARAGAVLDPETGILLDRISLEETDGRLRTGLLRVNGVAAKIQIAGPWVLEWEKPVK